MLISVNILIRYCLSVSKAHKNALLQGIFEAEIALPLIQGPDSDAFKILRYKRLRTYDARVSQNSNFSAC